jgi:hypothetical protein
MVERADASDGAGARTLASYFHAYGPAPEWDDIVNWPPDVFALTSLVLQHTESYRFVVAPPAGRHWPPLRDWCGEVRAAASAWRDAIGWEDAELPRLVRNAWETISRHRDAPSWKVRSGELWKLNAALLTLHAVADETCADLLTSEQCSGDTYERRAWTLLQSRGSLSRLAPTRVRIVPKTHLSSRGITLRSLSRYLALCYESVDVRWRRATTGGWAERGEYNIVLVPWPLALEATHFRPAAPGLLENMDLERFGFFEFAPERDLDCGFLSSVLAAAVAAKGRVDAVVFPEASVYPEAIPRLESALAERGATLLIAGVYQPATEVALGRNFLHFGVRRGAVWNRFEQDKHHRWCLDERQIRQYHLAGSLDPKKLWWEAIDLGERRLYVIDVGGGLTAAPLVCEDLASLDEVADLVRRIGPGLVVAILLDGPQLASRWPCRYGSVIADDPGSSVLTLTSYGMAARSRPPGKRPSRVVAHWNSRAGGVREIALSPGAVAVMLSTSLQSSTLWTADGRCHRNVPSLELTGVHQLHVPTQKAKRPRRAALRGGLGGGGSQGISATPFRLRSP